MTSSPLLHDFVNHGCDSRAAIELLHLVPLIYTHASGTGLPFGTDPVPADCLAANWSCTQSTSQLGVRVTIVSSICLSLSQNLLFSIWPVHLCAFTRICRCMGSSLSNLSPRGWYVIYWIIWGLPLNPITWWGPGGESTDTNSTAILKWTMHRYFQDNS